MRLKLPSIFFVALGCAHLPVGVAADSQPRAQLDSRQASFPFYGTSEGCYSSYGGGMKLISSSQYMSIGYCGSNCTKVGAPVLAIQDYDCYCGSLLPSPDSKLSSSACSYTCPGYGPEICGGSDSYNIWLTGIDPDPGTMGSSGGQGKKGSDYPTSSPYPSSSVPIPSKTRTSHTPKPTPTSHHHHHHHHQPVHHTSHHRPQPTHHVKHKVYTTTEDQKTIVKTVSPSDPSPSADSLSSARVSSSSSNDTTIAIAVGVVAGVLAFAALIALILFYLRRRRRMKNAENGHRRADSLNAFVASSGHAPGWMADKVPSINVNDNRLDSWIMQENKRASGGSFLADNEDYSRRILKVTNPDGT